MQNRVDIKNRCGYFYDPDKTIQCEYYVNHNGPHKVLLEDGYDYVNSK